MMLNHQLDILNSAGDNPLLLELVANSQETQALMWTAIVDLEGRISALELELPAVLHQDHQQLVLRQVVYQVQNKLARELIPGICTPYEARHTTFNRIVDHKKCKKERLMQLLQKYSDLKDGIEALNNQASPVAHPEKLQGSCGDVAVTKDLLQDVLLAHFKDSDLLEPVQCVLACLVDLSEQLQEPLFVDTFTDPAPVK